MRTQRKERSIVAEAKWGAWDGWWWIIIILLIFFFFFFAFPLEK